MSSGKFFDNTTLRRIPGAELANYNDSVTPSTATNDYNTFGSLTESTQTHDLAAVGLQEERTGSLSYLNSSSNQEQDENRNLAPAPRLSKGIQVDRVLEAKGLRGNEEPGTQSPTIRPSQRLLKDELGSVSKAPPLSPDLSPSGDTIRVGDSTTIYRPESSYQSSSASASTSRVQKDASIADLKKHVRDESQSDGLRLPSSVDDESMDLSHSSVTVDGPDFDKSVNHHRTKAEKGNLENGTSTPDAQLRSENEAQFLKPTQRSKSDVDGKTLSEFQRPLLNSSRSEQVNRACANIEESRLLERRNQPFQERRMPGMTREVSKDLMFSQRPPMRIDTGVPSLKGNHGSFDKTGVPGPTDTQSPSNSSTPLKATPTTALPSPPERMTTRVSSGALRHKSVSEILGETPKSTTHQGDRAPIDKVSNESAIESAGQHTPRYSQLVASPESLNFRSRLSELKEREKERSKLSTVVFARQQPVDGTHNRDSSSQRFPGSDNRADEDKDYLLTLFTAQASAQQPSLNTLLGSAHKTLTTSNHYLEFHEQQDCRILKRIYHLQNSNRWSLRQIARSVEPQCTVTHWDILLDHVRWMQTDFREERKWKLAAAKNLADWCAEWIASSPKRRESLQVYVTNRELMVQEADGHATPVSLHHTSGNSLSNTTPELVSSADDDMTDTAEAATPSVDLAKISTPAAIFSLAAEDVIFEVEKTAASEKLLAELPFYRPFNVVGDVNRGTTAIFLDKVWRLPLIPISKFATGKMVIQSPAPSRKRSRYEYEDTDAEHHAISKRFHFSYEHSKDPLPPEKQDVALFNSENKHIIDRLHAAHAFRPPSEFSMPSQSFFESRNGSQWTWAEDDELRRLVKEYAYNWSLISSCLSSPSMFSSGPERRTPWECFERWVSFEGLPGDMNRTQYFRTWYSRRDAAKALLSQQAATQTQQQQQANSSSQLQVRRRSAEPTRVERRRNNKHLALVHAMQKVAKKKETTIQKQQHVASLAAMRKATEATQPRQRMQTPQEFSRVKHERECRMQEKQEMYRQQMLAQQRVSSITIEIPMHLPNIHKAALMQKASQQSGQQQGNSNIPMQARNGIPPPINVTSPHLASSVASNPPASGNGQIRPLSSTNGILPNGIQASTGQNSLRGVGISQAPMQSHMQGQQRMTHDMRMIMEASRVQQEQQYLAAQRQQRYPQANGGGGSSSSPQPTNMSTPQANAAMLASLQAANGKLSPGGGGISGLPRTSASPRLTNAVQAQQLSNGVTPMVNQIATSLKARMPNASPEQIRQMATEQLNQQLRSQNSQVAMQAAAGINIGSIASNGTSAQMPQQQQGMNFGNGMLNPAMYAQYMQPQPAAQPNRGAGASVNGVRPPSRGDASQMRNGSSQGTNHSPRPLQAQMAGVQ